MCSYTRQRLLTNERMHYSRSKIIYVLSYYLAIPYIYLFIYIICNEFNVNVHKCMVDKYLNRTKYQVKFRNSSYFITIELVSCWDLFILSLGLALV